MFSGLSILGYSRLKFSRSTSHDEYSTVRLRGACDHVLDEITVAGGVYYCHVILGRLELPQGDVDSDTTLTLKNLK